MTSEWSSVWSFTTGLSGPTLLLPTNHSTVSTKPTLSWNLVPGSLGYHLTVSEHADWSLPVYNSDLAANTYSFTTALANNKLYYWHVYATNTGGNSSWSETWDFTTSVAIPNLSSPANLAVLDNTTPTLNWDIVTGAQSYIVQYSTTPNFASGTFTQFNIPLGSTHTQPLSGLTTNTTYYWRVNATSGGVTSEWSSVWSFTTGLDGPALISPANGVTVETKPTLAWGLVPGATSYHLIVSEHADWTSPVYNSDLNANTYSFGTALDNNKTYYWRVYAINTGGNSNWSVTWHFTTSVAIPNLNSPLNLAVLDNTSPTLIWDIVPGATSYVVEYSTTANFSSAVVSFNITSGATHTQPITGLNTNTTYYWHVNASSGGITSNWSSVWSFTTGLSGPVLVSPVYNTTVSTTPTFNWNTTVGAIDYKLQIFNNSTFTDPPVLTQTGIPGTSWTVPSGSALTANQKFYWRVAARNTGGYSGWSVHADPSFTTSALIPTLIYPTNGAIGVMPDVQFLWGNIAGAASYTLQVSTDPSFPAGAATFEFPGLTNVTKLVSLMRKTLYYWRVAAIVNGNQVWSSIWSFRTAGALIAFNPSTLTFDTTVVNRKKSQTITINNIGTEDLIISSLDFGAGVVDFTSPDTRSTPITIHAGSHYSLTVDFLPLSTGVKYCNLKIYHTDATQDNPIQITITGTAVATLARIFLPQTLDMGTATFLADYKEKTLTITNTSSVAGDFLRINNLYFETAGNLFSVVSSFPIFVDPGNSVNITVRFYPNETGTLTNILHVSNSSLNNPEATVRVTASVVQPNLIVAPSRIDFGHTSKDTVSKRDTIKIQNYSPSTPYTISSKVISGDVSSFNFIKNNQNISLAPGQTDTIIVEFFPHTSGRKDGTITINTTDPLAPKIYISMTGIGGENPVLYSSLTSIDFGDVGRNETRDTVVLIRNDGSLDLNISSIKFIGTDKDLFSFVSGGTPVVLRNGQFVQVKIRIRGNLPAGNKNAQLQILCDDPDNSTFTIALKANVRTNILSKDFDRINFDTVVVGYSADTSFTLKNNGNLSVVISKFYVDGTYASDFSLSGFSLPFEIISGGEKVINLKFTPLAPGLRFARIVINSNDPANPEQTIILHGTGKVIYPELLISPKSLDFGKVVIYEKVEKSITIYNTIKYSKLRIDSIYLDPLTDQPFSINSMNYPITITDSLSIKITFNPRYDLKSYSLNLNIMSNNIMEPITKVALTGNVMNPGMIIHLAPVLSFGKVAKDSSKTMSFTIENTGECYLKIDSIMITGDNASEFTVVKRTYPFRIDPEETDNVSVIFTPKTVGSKNAVMIFYCNDRFALKEVNISGECILGSSQVLGVIKIGAIPREYSLSNNYPNPFNPSTRFEYGLPDNALVSVKIYNYLGQEVETLINEQQSAGYYTVEWHPYSTRGGLPSGVYFFRLIANSVNKSNTTKFIQLRKMLYVR